MALNDLTVTRLPYGIVNVGPDVLTSSLKKMDPLLYQDFMDDFNDFVPTAWTVTETQAGATQANTAGAGGLLLLTNSAANNDVNQIQKPAGSFLPVAGKRTFMRCRFQLSDVLASAFVIGFTTVSADATVLANSLDGIFFRKPAADATISLYCRQDNTTGSVSAEITDLVNATMIELGFTYDGGDRLYYEINGAVQGFITVSAATLPNLAGAPVISLKNGEAVAKTATADYLWIAQER